MNDLALQHPMVATSFGVVCVERSGSPGAPPLFAIHGVPSSRRDLLVLAPHLGSAVDLIGIDMPGFGDSELGEARSIDDWAQVVVEVADALGCGRFSVIGHSLGGLAAMTIASRHPDRVERLLLLNSAGVRPHELIRQNPPAVFAALMEQLGNPDTREQVMAVMRELYATLDLEAPDDWRRLRCQLRIGSSLDFDGIALLAPRVQARTTVIHAVDDPGIETAIARDTAAAIPGAILIELAQGGHFPQRTRPELVASHILAAFASAAG